MSDLKLSFQTYNSAPQEFFRIGWYNDRPLTWAALLMNNSKVVGSVNTDLVMATTPPGHKIFFGAVKEHEHVVLKQMLGDRGDFYQEKSYVGKGLSTIADKGGIRKRLSDLILTSDPRVQEKWVLIVASTTSRDVISYVFRHYELEYGSVFTFPFMISKQEPKEWIPKVERFFSPSAEGEITATMIEENHCNLATYWEHGMELVTNKITPTQIKDITQAIANRHSLELKIEES